MADTPRDFFISYTGVDRAWAEWIAWALEAAGYSTLIQAWDFRPGTNFVQSMDEAAKHARRTLAVLSPDYFNSLYTQPEWQAAFGQDPTSGQAKLLPVRVRECDPEGLLGQIVYIDLVGLTPDEAKAVLLAGVPTERAKPQVEPPFPDAATSTAEPRFPGSLPPIWNVPHDRNPNFTGRTDLLSGLYDSLHAGNATVLRQALRGLGGVGKTQLALEYAYRHAADYSVVWWVPSETSPATVYAELSRELGLPEAEAIESEVREQAARRWLEQHEGWLLVFDNATEPETVKPYLPHGASGHVIITSRYWDWGEVASGLGVEVFERDTESVPFLLRRTSQTDVAAARVLADALGNLPLAQAQASTYIATRGTTLAEYTELFETRRDSLWQRESPPDVYTETVSATWSLAMEEIEREASEAAELLYLLAYFASEPVSRDLLLKGAEHLPERLKSLVTEPLDWQECQRVFRRYGLVEVTEAGLLVHRLVQAVTRDRLAALERQVWVAAAVQVVAAVYPEDTYNPRDISIWSRCAALLGHALVTADHAEGLAVALEATGSLLSRIESYLDSQGRYQEALPLSQRALSIGESTLGAEHPTVAIWLNNLANLYRDQGRYEDAEPLYLRALSIDESTLGAEHPTVAIWLNNLANLYQDQGRYEDAEPLYLRALSISESTLGAEHPDVAIWLNNLANLYQDQGRYEDAEPLYLRALSISESTLGAEHPDTASSLNNLGSLLQAQGDLSGAKPYFERALAIWEQVLGPEHPDTASSLNNLGSLLESQGDLAGAKPYFERALAICEQVLGPEHPDTASSLNNLGSLLQAQGDLSGAKPYFERALAIREQVLGPEHPDTAMSLNNLGSLLESQGDLSGAKPYFERALAILQSRLGEGHTLTQSVRANLEALDKPDQPPTEAD